AKAKARGPNVAVRFQYVA
ncbi:unnamed protein product, partial [Adineta steineri]